MSDAWPNGEAKKNGMHTSRIGKRKPTLYLYYTIIKT